MLKRKKLTFHLLFINIYCLFFDFLIFFIFFLGGCCGSTKKRTIVGGWAWAWWLVTDVQRLSLSVMTLNPMCENVETAQGVPLTVTGVAQCKIMKMMNVYYFHHQADELLGTASEQFLGKSVNEIKQTILQTLEGHLRAILDQEVTALSGYKMALLLVANGNLSEQF
uniref:Uncharacterized protein n=1 Tax=Glossina pallidipes TaxID=7398 RepID=A0A1A9Z4U3_GLOPL